jgi:hypothetical protein
MIVCLRDGKCAHKEPEAVEQLLTTSSKAIYPDEAKNAELDITAKIIRVW